MNKGEKKQQEWINIVNNVVASAPNMSRDEKDLLQYISKHENIPRKKPKFMNFVKSAMGYRVNVKVVESCWTKLESAFKEMSQNSQPINNNGKSILPEKIIQSKNCADNENKSEIIKQNGQSTKINSEKQPEVEIKATELKSKKRKLKSNNSEEIEEPTAKLTKIEENLTIESKTKFDWHNAIIEIFSDKNEISLKKLEKKIVKKYLQHYSTELSREKINSKLQKKLKKHKNFTINDNKVKRT